jgi:hypothetical protein
VRRRVRDAATGARFADCHVVSHKTNPKLSTMSRICDLSIGQGEVQVQNRCRARLRRGAGNFSNNGACGAILGRRPAISRTLCDTGKEVRQPTFLVECPE